jgi:UDP-N-acetylmuramoylalanine--D-glutamate ligase
MAVAVKSVLVLGLGKTGQAVVRFFLDKGIPVHGVDCNAALFPSHSSLASLQAAGAALYHDSTPITITDFDLLVISPGIPQTHSLIQQALQQGVRVTGEIDLACQLLSNRRVVGITGTNGKTTVTLLVTHVLNHCGIPAKAVGNVGEPLISEVIQQDDAVLVVELSSYQLETMSTPILDAAAVLNITPDHLDRYPDMDNYAKAKLHIANCLKEEGFCYIEQQTLRDYSHLSLLKRPWKTYGFSFTSDLFTDGMQVFVNKEPIFDLPDPYRGRKNHDLENLLAAYALCHKIGVSATQFVTAIRTFAKPPHRIEFVREKDGIKFYDDSKGTNTDAVIKAVSTLRTESQTAKIVLIAGGVDKGWPYDSWINGLGDSVSAIYAIGQAAQKIKQELGHAFAIEVCASLEEAVSRAAQTAKYGDYVLLSPGCSSFDMFRDYAHRGDEFKRIVKQL